MNEEQALEVQKRCLAAGAQRVSYQIEDADLFQEPSRAMLCHLAPATPGLLLKKIFDVAIEVSVETQIHGRNDGGITVQLGGVPGPMFHQRS